MVRVHFKPEEAPEYDVPHIPLKEKLRVTVIYLLPLGFIIFMVIGLIFLGVATPTESAAAGTLGSFILAIIYRRLTWEAFRKSVVSTLKVTGMIMMIIIAASTYGEILAFTGAAAGLTNFIINLNVAPMLIVVAMVLVILLLDCFMETVAIMMITIPIFMPVINAFKFDPLWFGVVMLCTLETGLICPPFGVTLFVMKGVAPPEVTMADIWKAALPFAVVDLVCIALVLGIPAMSTIVPSLMGMMR